MSRAVAIALAVCLLYPVYAGALHRQTPGVLQVTPTTGAGDVQNPAWGGFRFIVFDSDADIIGNGNNTRQLFLFDLRDRTRKGLQGIQQLTLGTSDPQHGTTGRRGRRIFYDALDGGGIRQIYLVDRRSGYTQQITDGTADSTTPRADKRGRTIVFESEADFFSTGATGKQIFAADLRALDPACPLPCGALNQGLIQITNKSGNNHNPVTGNRGRAILLESDADLTNVGETSNQVYLVQNFFNTTLLATGPGESRNPSVSRNGRQIAFESDGDVLNNGSTGTQIFFRSRATRPIEQLTSVPGGLSTSPSLSTRGRFMTFLSADDLTGSGNSTPNVFGYDVRRAAINQVTTGAGTAPETPAHSTGVFAAFIAEGDLAGNGTTGKALYVINNFALDGATVP